MANEEMYKPLPSFLTVDKSKIHGLGIFATKDVANQTNLGLSHVLVDKPNIFVRTPLGGFINHTPENPNCVLIRDINFTHLFFVIGDIESYSSFMSLFSLRLAILYPFVVELLLIYPL